MNCKLCNREASEKEFCSFHAHAHQKIKKTYKSWKEGLDITWKEYLSEIEKNALTGEWAKEVLDFIKT